MNTIVKAAARLDCCAFVTMVSILARTPSVRKKLRAAFNPSNGSIEAGIEPAGFQRDTTTTAHRPGSRRSNGLRN